MTRICATVRIDQQTKEQAEALFTSLGLDLSSAIEIFLRQCVLRGGLPFSAELPRCSQSTIEAMEEARRIADDPRAPAYDSMEDLKKALEG